MAATVGLAGCGGGGGGAVSPGSTGPGTPPVAGGGTGGGGPVAGTCPAGFTTGAPVGGRTSCILSGSILNDVTLVNVPNVAYRIRGRIDIGADIGATGTKAGGQPASLTLQPGVVLFGESGEDYIVVNRGSRLNAQGTAAEPIVMTSRLDLERQADTDPTNNFGGALTSEWGGLVVLGRAPINRCRTAATPGTAACENVVEGVTNPEANYGGAEATDNSGIYSYLQVRFAGFAINTAGNELNGITFAGVGSGTVVDRVQVHNNEDDGIELFGGTVNLRYVVLTGNKDDSFDTDNGWNGNVQFMVVVQNPAIGDNIVEASSVAPGVAPLSSARVSNFTFIANSTNLGNPFRLNTGTVGRYVNGVVASGRQCFRWEGTAGDGVAGFSAANDPGFNSVLFDCAGGIATSNSDTAAVNAAVAADANNRVTTSTLAARLLPGPTENAIPAFNVTTLGSFFTPVNYIGAFSPTETETQNWAAGWTFGLFTPPACPTGTTATNTQLAGRPVCSIAGVLRSNVRLVRGLNYQLAGRVDVGVDTGADGTKAGGVASSMTIESGVQIFGNSGSDYLVVNRGSRIFANGTANAPIIFTSFADLNNSQTDPANAIGEWGGLVILGRAPINRCAAAGVTRGSAQCEQVVEGVTNPEAVYGGAVANDSSGSLRYIQVKHAGFAINTQGNELNGITLAGAGNGTTVEFVQVHNNADDGIELFGGTVNMKYVVLTGNDDDMFDTDNGWNGGTQFLIALQRPGGGDNIVEASSVGTGLEPLSDGRVSNFTFVANSANLGNPFRLNTGTIGRYVNGVVSSARICMRWESSAGAGSAAWALGADPAFASVLFSCTGGLATTNSIAAKPAAAVAADPNNTTAIAATLTNRFINGPAEAARTAFNVTTFGSFFTPVNYVGAVRDANDTWWRGWSCGLEAATPC